MFSDGLMGEYVDNFLAAITDPLPRLQKSFAAEEQLLTSYVDRETRLLAVGMESARPLPAFATDVASAAAVADEEDAVEWMRQHIPGKSVDVRHASLTDLPFNDNAFHLTYSSYNVIGTVSDESRPGLVAEMARVTKPGGHILNITWRPDAETTDFLSAYYPRIGIDVETVNAKRAITEKGIFRRMTESELVDVYKSAAVDNVLFENVGPVWHAATGIHPR